jgi:hypothetical protein
MAYSTRFASGVSEELAPYFPGEEVFHLRNGFQSLKTLSKWAFGLIENFILK